VAHGCLTDHFLLGLPVRSKQSSMEWRRFITFGFAFERLKKNKENVDSLHIIRMPDLMSNV